MGGNVNANVSSTFIIAEAGVNHNGSLELAHQLVDAAAAAGADAVKFQTFVPELVISVHAPKAAYQQLHTDKNESQLDMVRKLCLPFAAFGTLQAYANSKGIEFMTTAFDHDSLDFIRTLNLKRIKIPSGEITNFPYLCKIAEFALPTLLSSGMANLQEIEAAINVLTSHGTPRDSITVLHCNTEYPTPLGDVNLRAMSTIGEQLQVAIGYSDHTLGIDVAVAAVARGATVIEKHFTLDKHLAGPDHQASLEPDELTQMVDAIRRTELILGQSSKEPTASEQKNIAIARKSIVAAKPIKAGEPFTVDNLTVKRPGTGINPMQWNEQLRKVADRDYDADELIAP